MVVVSRTLRSAARTRSQTTPRIRAAGRFSRAEPRVGCVRAVDHGQHLAERNLGRGTSQAISSRRTAGADYQPRSFQLEQDLDQVTLGNRVGIRDLADAHWRCVRTLLGQRQQGQTGIFRLRRNLHRATCLHGPSGRQLKAGCCPANAARTRSWPVPPTDPRVRPVH